jgi:hypothetical protein
LHSIEHGIYKRSILLTHATAAAAAAVVVVVAAAAAIILHNEFQFQIEYFEEINKLYQ